MEPPTSSAPDDRLARWLRSTGGLLARRDSPFLARCYVQLLLRAIPGRELEMTDLSGHRQQIDTRDQMGANALVGRYRLPPEVMRFVRPNHWVIDCGANIGIITSQLCAAVGPSGTVWACEPVAANVERLESLRSENDLRQLTVMPYAIGAEPGSVLIGMPPPGHSGWGSITKSFGIAERIPVEVETLDRLAATSAPPGQRLRLLKVDVEGFETEVIAGAAALLEEHHPVVYCEFNDVLLRDRGQSSIELLERFSDLGYHPSDRSPGPIATLPDRVVNLVLEH